MAEGFISGGGSGGSSGGSSGFNFATPATQKPKAPVRLQKKGGRSFLGLVGNLAEDIKDSVVGLPAGVVMMFRDPIKTAKAVGEQAWGTYSPLFSGDLEKFATGV